MDSKLKIAVDALMAIRNDNESACTVSNAALAAIGPIEPDARQDERAAFRKWAESTGWAAAQVEPNRSNEYPVMQVQSAWEAWQARAALTARPAEGCFQCTPSKPNIFDGLTDQIDAMEARKAERRAAAERRTGEDRRKK